MPVVVGVFEVTAIEAGGVFNLGDININANKNATKLSADDGSFNIGDCNILVMITLDASFAVSDRGGDTIDADFLDRNVGF